jgi:hypothetical protein
MSIEVFQKELAELREQLTPLLEQQQEKRFSGGLPKSAAPPPTALQLTAARASLAAALAQLDAFLAQKGFMIRATIPL